MHRNMSEILIEARNKKKFDSVEEFKQILDRIKLIDKKIIIDWDDGAGEEWGTVKHLELGIIGMIHSKIGVLFWKDNEKTYNIGEVLANIYIVKVKDFNTNEWFIKSQNINQIVPELNWNEPESAMDCNNFCLSDFYVMTI